MPTPSELATEAGRLDQAQWFEFLDALDQVARQRQHTVDTPQEPDPPDRDAVAYWVALSHFRMDPGISEIWHLPTGAPHDEIRLIEVNDQFPSSEARPIPVDFGLDIRGVPFRLLVADVTSEQLEAAQLDPSQLPDGWSLQGATQYPRRT